MNGFQLPSHVLLGRNDYQPNVFECFGILDILQLEGFGNHL